MLEGEKLEKIKWNMKDKSRGTIKIGPTMGVQEGIRIKKAELMKVSLSSLRYVLESSSEALNRKSAAPGLSALLPV